MNILLLALEFFGLFILAIVSHELGHYWYFRMAKKKKISIYLYYKSWRKFGFKAGELKDYIGLDSGSLASLSMSGILTGAIVIFIVGLTNVSLMLIIVPYLMGCKKDIWIFFNNFRYDDGNIED